MKPIALAVCFCLTFGLSSSLSLSLGDLKLSESKSVVKDFEIFPHGWGTKFIVLRDQSAAEAKFGLDDKDVALFVVMDSDGTTPLFEGSFRTFGSAYLAEAWNTVMDKLFNGQLLEQLDNSVDAALDFELPTKKSTKSHSSRSLEEQHAKTPLDALAFLLEKAALAIVTAHPPRGHTVIEFMQDLNEAELFSLLPYDWDIDCYSNGGLGNDVMIAGATQMLGHFNLIQAFNINQDVLQNLLRQILLGYNNMPFHNKYHGFMTMYMTFHLLTRTNRLAWTIDDQAKVLGHLIGAFGHDLGHPGFNNAYYLYTDDKTYDENYILENFHTKKLYLLLMDNNILSGMQNVAQKAIFTRTFAAAIKHTQMSSHFGSWAALKEFHDADNVAALNPVLEGWLVHIADIGAHTVRFALADVWAGRCIEEFENQRAKETEYFAIHNKAYVAGTIHKSFGDELTNNPARAKSQSGFIGLFLEPVWTLLAARYPDLSGPKNTLLANKQTYINAV